jgi:hypothetical protein
MHYLAPKFPNMSTKQTDKAVVMQNELTEKVILKGQVKAWKKLQVYGDVSVLAHLLGKSERTITKAVNHGEGALELLRSVDKYFADRKAKIQGQ